MLKHPNHPARRFSALPYWLAFVSLATVCAVSAQTAPAGNPIPAPTQRGVTLPTPTPAPAAAGATPPLPLAQQQTPDTALPVPGQTPAATTTTPTAIPITPGAVGGGGGLGGGGGRRGGGGGRGGFGAVGAGGGVLPGPGGFVGAPGGVQPPVFNAGGVRGRGAVQSATLQEFTDVPPTEINDESLVLLNFTDQSAQAILHLLEVYGHKIILQYQSLPTTQLNFNSINEIKVSTARLALENLLFMNGIALMDVNDQFMKAVPSENIINQSPPRVTDTLLSSDQPDLKVYTAFFHLEHLSSADASTIIVPMMSPRVSSFIYLDRSDTIELTDTLQNLQRIRDVLTKADIEQLHQDTNEKVFAIQLKNAQATQVATTMQSMQTSSVLKKYISEDTTFFPDTRTNQVLIVTPPSTEKLLREIITDDLDKDVDPNTHSDVIFIKQADAQTLATLLQQVVTGQSQAASATGRTTLQPQGTVIGGAQQPAPAPAPAARGGGAGGGGFAALTAALAGQAATPSGPERGEQQFSPYVTIVPDTRSNSIVVYGTDSDIRQVHGLIDKLDTELAQVRIEVVITEVTLSSGQVSGLSSFGITYNQGGNTSAGAGNATIGGHDIGFSTSSGNSPGGQTPAFTMSGSLTNFNLDAVFSTAANNSKVRVLSAPSITTQHNSQASIQVTEQRPVITSTTTQIQNAASVGNNVTSTVQYVNIGIQLQVQPLIGPDGTITMQVLQQADSVVGEQSINGTDQPIIGHRQAQSTVTIKDGEVIVMGGLQTSEHDKTVSKVWLLGDLPLIGSIFRPESEDDSTRELIIFIRPTIVESVGEADLIAQSATQHSLASASVKDYLTAGYVTTVPAYRPAGANILDPLRDFQFLPPPVTDETPPTSDTPPFHPLDIINPPSPKVQQ